MKATWEVVCAGDGQGGGLVPWRGLRTQHPLADRGGCTCSCPRRRLPPEAGQCACSWWRYPGALFWRSSQPPVKLHWIPWSFIEQSYEGNTCWPWAQQLLILCSILTCTAPPVCECECFWQSQVSVLAELSYSAPAARLDEWLPVLSVCILGGLRHCECVAAGECPCRCSTGRGLYSSWGSKGVCCSGEGREGCSRLEGSA